MAVNLAVLFLAAELVLRIAYSTSHSARCMLYMVESHPGQDYTRYKSLHQMVEASPWTAGPYGNQDGFILNRDGLLTDDYTDRPVPGTSRVILLGDSFLFDVDDKPTPAHFANILENSLGRYGKSGVINLGVPGTGPKHYLRMLELGGIRLSPCAVVACLFIGNDLRDEPEKCWDFPMITRASMVSLTVRLARNAHLLATGWAGYSTVPHRPRWIKWPRKAGLWVPELAGSGSARMTNETYLNMQAERAYVFDSKWIPPLECQWKAVQGVILKMQEEARKSGAALHIMLIPDETQLNQDLYKSVGKTHKAEMDLKKPQRMISLFLEAKGIPCLDLLPAYQRAYADGKTLYKERDSHWNREGKEIAARLLALHLREYGWPCKENADQQAGQDGCRPGGRIGDG